MDILTTLLVLSLLHAGHPQDFPSGPYNGPPQEPPPGPFRDGPQGRQPPPDYGGPSNKPPEAFGPLVRQYGPGPGPFLPPQGQYGRPPPDMRPPYPFDPYGQKRPFNKPPSYNGPSNGPYGQMGPPFQQGPQGPYGGGPPRRPDYNGQPPMNRPPWMPAPGYQNGPGGPGGYGPGGPGGYRPGGLGGQGGPGGYAPQQQQQQQWQNNRPKEPAQAKPIKGPMDFMADVVNNLATRVLLDHVTARGNFVFSPYGATSVLCVLNEGSSGMSAVQLSTTLDLPKDIELVRVGMRDLHRHLKSYFQHNGFLQGVDLSHNNTSLRSDFIPLLRFYGYHVDEEAKANQQSTPMPDKMETTTMPMDDDPTEAEEAAAGDTATEEASQQPEAPPSDSMVEEESPSEEPATEEQPTDEPATEEAPEEESKRKKRATSQVAFPDIELNNGIAEKGSSPSNPSSSDPLAPRKKFRLFSGEFTDPVVVQERTEMLQFASLPQLGSVAALIPLDEPRYGLLVMVPYDGRTMALKQLVKEMTSMPLRNILDALRPNHVHFTVPAFAAKGTVVLTSALQQIGIHDIFDPRNSKLDRMSVDPGLFVRHLEQVIDMDFGKVKSLHTRVITARSTSEVLDAMRPFVYLVIDRVTQVALLAGKVEDPTTDRIF